MDRNPTLDRAAPPVPATRHQVLGGGGVKLHAREWGNPQGPALLFIHGWSQSDLCWLNQVRGDLADTFRIVTFDLRGHGLSDKPAGPEHYGDGQLWADDVAWVIDQTGLEQPILVAWSYGGYIVADYLRAYGDAATASWYDGVGHMPFWEAPDRFARELAGLATQRGLMTSRATRVGHGR
jgi:non-heme chloroperoxidase